MPTVQSDLKNDRRKQTRHRLKRSKPNRCRAPARPNEYERAFIIARRFSLCRWARRLLLDRRCPILFDAFCALGVAQWPSSVLPATEVRSTAPVSAHAQLARVLGVRQIVGMRARPRVGSRAPRGRNDIVIVDASRIRVHFPIARVLYLMRARRTP